MRLLRLLTLTSAVAVCPHSPSAQANDPLAIWRSALTQYEHLARTEEWPPLSRPITPIGLGAPYADAAALHRRLVLLGDLPAETATPDAGVLSASLVQGLRRFQARHQLDADGVLGPDTFAALSVPLTTRVEQLRAAVDIMSETSNATAPTVLVNVPTAELWAWSRGPWQDAPDLTMRVIVGTPRTPTPTMTAPVDSVTFRPYWRVPASIAQAELWPLIRKDPGYLERHHFDVIDGTGLRQRPGANNALGLVRFDVRSTLGVFLHDTPSRQLFTRNNRALSHGCVRVEQPAALAAWMLAPEGWTRAMVDTAMHDADNRRVPLAAAVELRIVAAPAVVRPDGMVTFGSGTSSVRHHRAGARHGCGHDGQSE
ncbi:MAG: L,D-transpeptidase family protein [Vicinamibacterales bacterium]